jgi:cytidyltransferase-like protein
MNLFMLLHCCYNELMKSAKTSKAGKEKWVMVSGGFDPIHIGHVRLFQEAKALGDKLVVVINNDYWKKLKGSHIFMPVKERKEIIEAIGCVDKVIISGHTKNTKDLSVCEEVRKFKPDIFANGGDRKPSWHPIPEVELCKELGIKLVYNVGHGGKVRSSSELVKNYHSKTKVVPKH